MVFILASSSASRLKLLERVGCIPDRIIAPDIDETPLSGELPPEIALRLAQLKAEKVYRDVINESQVRTAAASFIVLAADTVCAVGRLSLPKATTEEEAKFCVNKLSGRRHKIHTGICVIGKKRDGAIQTVTRITTTTLALKRLSPAEKEWYISSGEWQNTAGGYSVEGRMACFIRSITGTEISNICGLPLSTVYPILRHFDLLNI